MATTNPELLKSYKIKHFANRVMERFGMSIEDKDLTAVVSDIVEGINRPLIITENGNSFHEIMIGDTKLIALFDWSIEYFVTAYRHSWLKQMDDGSWEYVNKLSKKSIQKKDQIVSRLKKKKIDERFLDTKLNRTFMKKEHTS